MSQIVACGEGFPQWHRLLMAAPQSAGGGFGGAFWVGPFGSLGIVWVHDFLCAPVEWWVPYGGDLRDPPLSSEVAPAIWTHTGPTRDPHDFVALFGLSVGAD